MTGLPIGAPQTGGNLLGDTAGRIGSQAEFMVGKDVDTLKKLGSGAMGALAAIGTLPQRAIQNSQFATTTGVYDPETPVEAAMTVMGGRCRRHRRQGRRDGADGRLRPQALARRVDHQAAEADRRDVLDTAPGQSGAERSSPAQRGSRTAC